jgi:cobalt-zinc-cadmium efflux system protein
VNRQLLERFHIRHTTIQFEHVQCDIAHGCVIPVREADAHIGHRH